MLSPDDVIIKEKDFFLNDENYIARLYFHKGKTIPYGEIVKKENNQRVGNMKGLAREFLKSYGIEVSTDARVMVTHSAVAKLIQKLEELESEK